MTSLPNPLAMRLKVHMQRMNLSTAELARRSDVKASFLTDIMNGKSANPSGVKLARVSEVLGVSVARLVGIENTPAMNGQFLPAEEEYVAIPTAEQSLGGNEAKLNPHDKPYYFRRSWVMAQLRTSPENLCLFTVQDDSMSPSFLPKDRVLIDTSKTVPSPPGVFLLQSGHGLSLKRLEYTLSHPPDIRILSDNKHYPTLVEPLSRLHIFGRAAWFSREM